MDIQGILRAVVLVKAAPQVGTKHGETVCCAAVTPERQWVRIYPVKFRDLDTAKRFRRWDIIEFKWRLPKDDQRRESRRLDHQAIEIVGRVTKKYQAEFLAPIIVTGLQETISSGGTFALLRPHSAEFVIEKRTEAELDTAREKFRAVHAQQDLFAKELAIPLEPCPFKFKYRYDTDDGSREGTCQDWETDATFFNWRRQYGEKKALEYMQRVFGEEIPTNGIAFAMGTHSRYPDTWLINGVIQLDETNQLSFL